jgi:hypothetical protein
LGALLVASTALAQPGGGGPGRGFGFGFGFGGGMRMPSTVLLRMPEVQKELSINDDQKGKLQDVATEIRQDMQKEMQSGGQRPNIQDMTDEERNKFFADMRARSEKLNKSADEKLGKVLTSDQLSRLKELQLQSQGANALVTPDVVAKLTITSDQKSKIQDIIQKSRPQGGGFDPNATDEERQAAAKERREARAKALKDSLAVLTDEQRTNFSKMTGKEFKFPDNMGFGGFGGRGRGGNGGNGGGGGNGGNT